jgi:hypothetical protein
LDLGEKVGEQHDLFEAKRRSRCLMDYNCLNRHLIWRSVEER